METLYKSEQGKREILNLYEEKLLSLGIEYSSKKIATQFGMTHLLVCGDPTNPPLMLFHGSNACAPIALDVYPNLVEKYQVFSVDALGQPNKSEGVCLSMKDNSYGVWINELIYILGLDKVHMAGFSLGGLMILKTLLHDESKIEEVFLASPAFIVNGNPLKALWKIFIQMNLYMRTKKIKYLEKFLKELFTDKDEFAIAYLSKVFMYFKMDFSPVPIISNKEASKIETPITIIAAGKDLLFPGTKMLKRANKIFPSLKETILLEESKHVQNKAGNLIVENTILRE